jgi:two-component system response regulator MprA
MGARGSPTMNGKLLIVEDDAHVREAVARALRFEGYDVHTAVDGNEALVRATELEPDAILLDVLMPGTDGLAVCRRLRERGDRTPILMLTARHEVNDRVAGLDAGADDYLVKPFALDELLARLRALLRRTSVTGEDHVLRAGDLSLDPQRREAWRGSRELGLTKTEFDLLELLLANAEIVVTRDTIYERIWGFDFETSSKSLDVYIGYLRRKTEADGEPRLIRTVRGVGYTLRPA